MWGGGVERLRKDSLVSLRKGVEDVFPSGGKDNPQSCTEMGIGAELVWFIKK